MAIEINEFVGTNSIKKVPKKKGDNKDGREGKEGTEKEKSSK